MLRALFYAYIIGGLTFIPLCIFAVLFITIYTSVPVGDPDVTKKAKAQREGVHVEAEKEPESAASGPDTKDVPRTRKGWLTMRRTFEESAGDGSYVTLVRSFLDSRSKDPKRSRPKDMWYVVLKGKVLYLYEDEEMSECEAAIELSGHQVVIYPEGLPDGELFAKRNAICLKPRTAETRGLPSVTKQMSMNDDSDDTSSTSSKKRDPKREALEAEKKKRKEEAREEALDRSTPWFIFVRSNVEMEDWYLALVHASEQPAQRPTLAPLSDVFDPADMDHLVSTLDERPDVIPMRWLNALLGRVFFSYYRTQNLESYIIGRLMKKLSKVKRPAFLTEIAVTEVSVGNRAPMFSKPMLKELTKEGDASIEVHLQYKGEVRITVEATAVINLGARFKSYTVKLVLAAVLKELEGNLLVKVKRPPSNRIWYAFTQTPRMVMEVEPIVSDRQITWSMILSTIESKFKEIIQESVVMPNMDDIAFFESSGFEHRGGIWSDACRKPHISTTVVPTTSEDAQSVASAPVPEIELTSSEDSTTSSKPIEEPDLNLTRTASAPAEVPSTPNEDLPDTPRNNSRRNTWFAMVRTDDETSAPPQSLLPAATIQNDEARGRTLEAEKPTSPRSQSTPKPESPRPTTPDFIRSDTTLLQTNSKPQSSRRSSSSQFSLKVDQEAEEETPIARPRSTPNTPRKNSDSSSGPRSPSPPSSFFSTLKSKAADKQAISNTAKEAMRKWGVNWGGFKKDSANTAASASDSGESSSQAQTQTQTGSSPPSSTSRLSDSASAFAQKARASYAEVRAAVAERKERERNHQHQHLQEGSSSDLSSLATPTAKTPTNLSGLFNSPEQQPSEPAAIASPPPTRLRAPSLKSKKSTPSISRVQTQTDIEDLPDPVEAVRQEPIHVQPQAKTMSIPGIHASHRGEVQSMGYVAPQPPPPPPAQETMLKNPAIQSVYRLWKTTSSNGGQPDAEARSQPEFTTQAGGMEDESSATRASASASIPIHEGSDSASAKPVVSVSPSSSPPRILVKPTPPPLPPRSTSALRPATNIAVSSDAPSASDALKSIVERNEGSRPQSMVNDASTPVVAESGSSQTTEGAAATHTEGEAKAETILEALPSPSPSVDPPQPKVPPALPPRRIHTPA
ncbi:hypothetical protein CVT26_005356 [Gymnopilus dilepis]|uniref:SMP-LTD domain-containing protein n=1 Tax=Gymnopilus dilepis TaxID=231916 RepID=A0A409YT02_9AGAR|nr:hypothetical protein CVT26_005356 [Gymnopilus dilepis]